MKRDVLIKAAVAALAVLGLAAFTIDWNDLFRPDGEYWTNDAVLDGNPTQLKSRVNGYLTQVTARDYAIVRRGDLLFAIDSRDYRARVGRAEADVAQAEANAATVRAMILQQEAQIAFAEAELAGAGAEVERTKAETARQAALIHTESYLARNWQSAVSEERQQLATARGDRMAVVAARDQIDVLGAQLRADLASVNAKGAALADARVQLGYTRILAPFDGVTTARLLRLGDYSAAGAALITVVPLRGSWVVANFREEQMRRMAPGQSATVRVDALPGVVLAGRVDSIEPVSQAEGSALPPDRATGSFTRIVQRVAVKITLNPTPALDTLLRPGLSVEVVVDTTGGAR